MAELTTYRDAVAEGDAQAAAEAVRTQPERLAEFHEQVREAGVYLS